MKKAKMSHILSNTDAKQAFGSYYQNDSVNGDSYCALGITDKVISELRQDPKYKYGIKKYFNSISYDGNLKSWNEKLSKFSIEIPEDYFAMNDFVSIRGVVIYLNDVLRLDFKRIGQIVKELGY